MWAAFKDPACRSRNAADRSNLDDVFALVPGAPLSAAYSLRKADSAIEAAP
jgi:hypothetical protein